MLTIRLQRVGRKHEPVFRLVLTDSKNGPKSGKFLEILGSYDARKREEAKFDAEKIKKLISNGAKLSETVHNFFIDKKVISGKKINKLPRKTPVVPEKSEKEAESQAESQAVKEEAEEVKTAASAESSSEPKEEKIE